MFKRSIFFLVLFVIIVVGITGCSNDAVSIDKSAIYIYVRVEPSNYYSENYIYYRAFCTIECKSDKGKRYNFKAAVVSVNGFQMVNNNNSFWLSTDLSLRPGDSVKINVSHPLVGDVEKTMIIPPVVTDLTSNNDIDQYIKRQANSLKLKWSRVNCDGYWVRRYFYEDADSGWERLSSSYTYSNSYIITDIKQIENSKEPYVKVDVRPFNRYYLTGFYNQSFFEVVAPSGSEISNLPK